MQITDVSLNSRYSDKQRMMASLAKETFCAKRVLAEYDPQLLQDVNSIALSGIDAKVKAGKNLSFNEAFSGMMFAVAATNNPIRKRLFFQMSFQEAIAKGVGFLQLMATKEALRGLTPEEVAGMVGAGMADLVFRFDLPEVVETCGMGGDRGWGTRKVKTINASTLSALVLSSLGLPTFKHGSYGNTAQIGSTDVPINFGAEICHCSTAEIRRLFDETSFWFSDAHSVKTIHYLSHLLMVETINHIVGPMTVPITKETKLFKLIGVNHHIHPEVIAKAYAILHHQTMLNLGGVVVVTGLDELPQGNEHLDPEWVAKHSFLDEVSPIATLVAFAEKNRFLGSFVITDEHFQAPPISKESLKIANTIPELMRADQAALQGTDGPLGAYLARNAALGLLASQGLNESAPFAKLPSHYRTCLEAINSGNAFQTLKKYVLASGGNFRTWS